MKMDKDLLLALYAIAKVRNYDTIRITEKDSKIFLNSHDVIDCFYVTDGVMLVKLFDEWRGGDSNIIEYVLLNDKDFPAWDVYSREL